MSAENEPTVADELVTQVADGHSVGAGPAPGTRLGRYFVIDEIGRGSAGVVVRAYDPKLQREVALKMVRTDALTTENEARVIREARAMALLNHPNVVHIYDVEIQDDRVMMAMELVEGTTLRKFVSGQDVDWRTVLDLYVAAGHGLAAAHAKGLLHRDFKPANVLVGKADVGKQRRVLVTDFGLARMQDRRISWSRESIDPEASGEQLDSSMDEELTAMGTVMGTLAYMPPEQHGGQELTSAADQYAFCVALWEGLCGRRPFSGETTRELFKAKLAGPPPWPRTARVPAKVADAIRRGLAVAPAQRWPSMEALLEAMTDEPRRRTGWLVAAVGLLALGGIVYTERDKPSPCAGAREQIELAWGAEQRAEVRDAFEASKAPYAGKVWQRVQSRLDEYAQQWTTAQTQVCEATVVRHEQSTELMDLRMGCLRRARRELETMTGLLMEANADLAVALEMLDGLPDVQECLELAPSEVAAPDPGDEEAVEELREQLAEVRALRKAGKIQRARERIESLRARTDELDYAPLRTEVSLERAVVAMAGGRYDEAAPLYESTLTDALRQGQWVVAFHAANNMIHLTADLMSDPARAQTYVAIAEGLVEYDPDDAARAWLDNNLAGMLHAQGKFRESEKKARDVVAAYERLLGPEHRRVTGVRLNLAILQFRLGRYAEAEEELRVLLARRIEELGETHPSTANTRNTLGGVLHARGKYEEAVEQLEMALEAVRASMGDGRAVEARLMGNVAVSLSSLERYDEAEAMMREALAMRREILGDDHPDVASAKINLASLMLDTKRVDEAQAEAREGVRILERAYPDGHRALDAGRTLLGRIEVEQGDLDDAIILFEAVWTRVSDDSNVSADDRADAAFRLGKALWDAGRERERALALARQARETIAGQGELGEELRAEIDAWLAKREPRE